MSYKNSSSHSPLACCMTGTCFSRKLVCDYYIRMYSTEIICGEVTQQNSALSFHCCSDKTLGSGSEVKLIQRG
jgi:hypothetical protein